VLFVFYKLRRAVGSYNLNDIKKAGGSSPRVAIAT